MLKGDFAAEHVISALSGMHARPASEVTSHIGTLVSEKRGFHMAASTAEKVMQDKCRVTVRLDRRLLSSHKRAGQASAIGVQARVCLQKESLTRLGGGVVLGCRAYSIEDSLDITNL